MKNYAGLSGTAARIGESICSYGIKKFDIGILLGTGWSEILNSGLIIKSSLKLSSFLDYEDSLTSHEQPKRIILAQYKNLNIIIIDSRIHMYEKIGRKEINNLVRLQTEMLIHTGIKKLVITSGVGSLQANIQTGDLVVTNNIITAFAPDPLVLSNQEFVSPQKTLDQNLVKIATNIGNKFYKGGKTHTGTHVMVRGPHIESYKDKQIFAYHGGDVVGMSTLPEILVCGLYSKRKIRCVSVNFVTNGTEQCSHKKNLLIGAKKAPYLSKFLLALFSEISK